LEEFLEEFWEEFSVFEGQKNSKVSSNIHYAFFHPKIIVVKVFLTILQIF